MRRLFLDIETSPNQIFSWRVGYKINVDYQNIIKERRIICICWKWENEKQVKFVKWDKKQGNEQMMKIIIPVLDEAGECSCTLHKMLLRMLADLKREREAEEQREANRQEEINSRKVEGDIE
jgi:hypothetical protein